MNDPQRLQQGFLSLAPDHEFAKSLLALLEEAVTVETQSCAVPERSSEARHFNAGRLAHALDLQAAVRNLMTPPQAHPAITPRVSSGVL